MLKRLYSKRSGFTLVEIIVAIAVFAVMSTLIVGIMQMATMQRFKNNEYGRQLAEQEQQIAKVEKNYGSYQDSYDDANKFGMYGLNFKKKSTDGSVTDLTAGGAAALAYEIKDADGNNTPEGLNYFVSPVSYDGKFSGSAGSSGPAIGSTGSASRSDTMASIWDVRLVATRGTHSVSIEKATKVEEYLDGSVKYEFTTSSISGTKMTGQSKALAEYKMYFYLKEEDVPRSNEVYTKPSGDKVKREMYLPAEILEVGYITPRGTGKPTVKTMGGNVVTVSVANRSEGGEIDHNNNYEGKGFTGEKTTFYVVFKKDPQISTDSFGVNATASGTGHTYTLVNVNAGTYQNQYVYGLYDYVETPV